MKAEYAAKLQAAEARVKEIEAARDEAKQQAAALAKELDDSKKSAQQVGGGSSRADTRAVQAGMPSAARAAYITPLQVCTEHQQLGCIAELLAWCS